jgi:hypothetical protein
LTDTILGAIIGAIIGVGGAIIGVALAFGLTWWRDAQREAKVNRSVRQLLRLECSQNVRMLKAYWYLVSVDGVYLPDVGLLARVGASPQEVIYDKRQRLANEPMPVWSRQMWESHLNMAAQALNDPI